MWFIIKDDSYEKRILNEQSGNDESAILMHSNKNAGLMDYYSSSNPYLNYEHAVVHHHNGDTSPQLIPNLVVQGDGSSYIRLAMDASKARLTRK